MIIGLVGKAKSGKDTVADYLVRYGFEKAAFADDLKKLCKDMFDLTDSQVNTQEGKETVDIRYGIAPREILQKVGTDWFRSVYPNIWVNRLITRLQRQSVITSFVVTDIRFPNEVAAIKSIGGIIVKLIRTDGGDIGSFASHASETALDNLPFTEINHIITAGSGELDKLYEGIKQVVLYNKVNE